MTVVNHVQVALADDDGFQKFHEVIVKELLRLGPHPRKPLNVRKAAELAGVSLNTAGKYVDILEAAGNIEANWNRPSKNLYLPEYPDQNEGSSRNGRAGEP